MKRLSKMVFLETKGYTDIIDITGSLTDFIKEESILNGLINVAVKGSTAGITSLEYEPNMLKDLQNALEQVAPTDQYYEHEKTWHDDNGVAHVRAALMGSSKSFPVLDGRLFIGTWQQVVLIDFDTCPRKRELLFTFLG